MRPILLTLSLLVFALPAAVRADDVVVLVLFPSERRAEMTAALRLELAGRATLVEDPAIDGQEATASALRALAEAHGATHVVWVVFPTGVLGPAEIRVLDLARPAPAHATTPEAWDVVDARVVAVLASSVMDASTSTSALPAAAPALPAAAPVTPDVAPTPALAPAPPPEPIALETDPEDEVETPTDPRAARHFSLVLGPSFAHVSAPGQPTRLGPATDLAFYARLTEWASVGVRLRLGGVGFSSLEGVLVSGAVGVPSILVSFREPLGTAAMVELGVHAEGGFFFYGRNASEWSFGLGVGAMATVELGAQQGIQIDYTLDLYGFGTTGSYGWGALTLAYVLRFD